ncbi:MAG: hypothetical protein EAZ08_07430 [Cytophagales bacterium]|nr:MAG: hypothetical protein EAZ08_07430 [Cytophagales bacterium]
MEYLSKIQEILKPYLIALSPEERRQLLKMGDKTVSFVEKTLDYVKSNPEFVPAYMNVLEFEKDATAVKNLVSMLNPITQIEQGVDDTEMLAGSEAYTAALIYYNSVKQAAKNNIPNAAAIYDDLSKRFDGQGKKKAAITK